VIVIRPAGVTAEGQASEARLLERLAALERRLEALEAAAAHRQRERLRTDDAALLTKLLPAAAGVFGSSEFLAADLLDIASPAFRQILAGRPVLAVGKLLVRGVGVNVDGYVLEDCGREHGARRWRIVQVLE
jgi:hypothetical protein